ncbi:MAG: hypothetical protein M3O30_12350 [Planctomycetota bacterium]|nr:hypothetical protein [Planctomycetota bacterium]
MDERDRINAAAEAHQRIKGHFVYLMGMIPRVPAIAALPMQWSPEHYEDRADFIFLGQPCRLKMNFAWLDTSGYVGQVVLQLRDADGKATDIRAACLIDPVGNFFLTDARRRMFNGQDPANVAAIIMHILGMLVPGPK